MSGIALLRRLLMKQAMKKSKDASGIMSLNKGLVDDVERQVSKWADSAKRQGQDIDKMGEQELKYLIELNKPKGPMIGEHRVIDATSAEGQGITDQLTKQLERLKPKESADVLDLSGKKIDTSKPILGGKNVPESEVQNNMEKMREFIIKNQSSKTAIPLPDIVTETIAVIKSKKPIDAMAEANSVIGRKGKYKNLTPEQSKKILKDTNDHIFERDIQYDEFGEIIKPDPEDLAGGGAAGRTSTGLNYLLGEDDQNSRVPLGGGKLVFDAARRKFLQIMGAGAATGVAAKSGLFSLLKAGKPTAQVLTSVPIGNASGMPVWFKPLVNKIIKEGDDVTKKLATKEREIVHRAQIDKDASVDVIQDLDTGNVRIEYDAADNLGYGPIQLDYKAGEVIEQGSKKGTKTKPEFSAVESEPRVTNWDGDIEFDGENIVNVVDDLLTDTTKLETYATGKNPTIKKLLKSEQKKKYVNKLHDDVGEQVDYIEKKSGHTAPEDLLDESPPDFASGGRVPLAGGKGVMSLIELIIKKFGKDTAKRASQLGKPQKTLDREMFQNFNKKLNPGKDSKSIIPKDEYREYKNDFNKEILNMSPEDQLRDEFPGISDRLIRQILTDKNPQRIAEVKQTMREALKMQEKGMGHEEIIEMFKKTPRTKNASGGRVSLSAGGLAGMLGE